MAKDVDSLTIVMEGREHDDVPLASYANFIRGTVSLLNSLDPRKTLLWRITAASHSSPLSMTATAESVTDNYEPSVVDNYFDAFRAAESGRMPSKLDPSIVSRAKKLLSLVLENGAGELEIKSPGRASIRPKPRPEKKKPEAEPKKLRWEYEDETELEGTLEIASQHNGHKFVIFDTLTNYRTDCIVNRDQLIQALDAMKRLNPRVSVFGKARYNRDGRPVEIIVKSFENLPGFDEITDPKRVQGINITDGIDSVSYIRSLRDVD